MTTLTRLRERKGNGSVLGMKVLLWVLYLEWWPPIEGLCHAFAVEMGSTDLDQENYVARNRGQ